jgi:uncharacterized protein (TIGR00251 family)
VGLRVSPGAKCSEIVGRHGTRWKVRVTAAPERGRANEAVCDLVAQALGVSPDRIRLVSGVAARDKVIEVVGMTAEEADRLLEGRQRKGDP